MTKPLHDYPALARRPGKKFGYPDMNPATLLFLTQELRRARAKHPSNEKNMELVLFYTDQLSKELGKYAGGGSSAITVQMTALQIAVMAIRLSEEGMAGHPYKGNAPQLPGPLGEHVQAQLDKISAGEKFSDKDATNLLDALTAKVTKK